MTEIVPVTKAQRLALKDKTVVEVAQELLNQEIPYNDAKVPEFPKPVVVNENVKRSMREIAKLFNGVVPEKPRALEGGEVAHLAAEAEALEDLLKLFDGRKEAIKEFVRIHLDETTKESYGVDAQGHTLVAQPGQPAIVVVPGSNVKFSNEYRKGRVTPHLDRAEELHADGTIDDATYRAITKQVRVVDEDRVRDHVLKTGDLGLLKLLVSQGRPTQAMNLRGK